MGILLLVFDNYKVAIADCIHTTYVDRFLYLLGKCQKLEILGLNISEETAKLYQNGWTELISTRSAWEF